MKIKKVSARQIIDSRGVPTIEVSVSSNKNTAKFSVPSGASVGTFEAVELRDNHVHEYFGKGVKKAVNHVNTEIHKFLRGRNPLHQKDLDDGLIDLDNTDNKSRLGANAILGTSVAIAKLVALEEQIPLYKYIRALYDPYVSFHLGSKYSVPILCFNMINGGAHASNDISAQEFMVIPIKSHSTHIRIKIATEINNALKDVLKEKNVITALGDEGGYAALKKTDLATDTESILQLLSFAAKKAGYIVGEDISFGIDMAVSKYYKEDLKGGQYIIPNMSLQGDFSGNFDALQNIYKSITTNYPILLLEDGASENDWTSWVKLKKELGKDIYIVGDDLTVTNPKRLQKALLLNCINSLIIKPNQIGTLSEVFETSAKAYDNKVDLVVSHRSGETTDDFIADLAVGLNAKFYKGGNIMRGERVVKYNRFLEIEEGI